MLTQAILKENLSYDPETGLFIRLVSRPNSKAGTVAGCVHSLGYIDIRLDWKAYKAHRLAWLYVYGCFPEHEIDHINGIKTDNRLCNLREVTHTENHQNKPTYKSNKSGITGVYFNTTKNRWLSYITVNKRRINLGCFRYKMPAIATRKLAEIKHGFHKNHGRKHSVKVI